MSLAVGTVLRVTQNLVWADGNLMQNVFHCVIGGTGGPYDEQDVADDMAEWMDDVYSNFVSRMSEDITAGTTIVYEYDGVDDDWDEIGTGVATFNPISTGDVLPRGVAALVSGQTTDPDVRGTKYFGGFTETVQTDGSWSAALVTELLAAGADMVTQFVGSTSGATFNPGVWSPKNTAFYAHIATYLVNVIANYQRRRRPGVGV